MTQLILGLQQFGVIPFEIRTLKKRHTEKWRARRIVYNKAILTQRHRWCVEKQRIFASFIKTLVYFITKQWFARFLKTFLPKLSATRTLRLCRSLCLRHLRDIVCFHLRVLPLSVWLLYVVGLLYHSIFRKSPKVSHPQKVGLK